MTRYLEPHEECFTATEIVKMHAKERGINPQEVVFPSNVGLAAKRLDLDYIEIEDPLTVNGREVKNRQRKYGHGDMPRLFEALDQLYVNRGQYKKCNSEG